MAGSRLALKERHESVGESDKTQVVDGHLVLDLCHVDGMGLAKVHHILDTRVEKSAVEIWMRFGDASTITQRSKKWNGADCRCSPLDEAGNVIKVCKVKDER